MKSSANKPLSTDRVMLTVRIPRALHDELKAYSLKKRLSLQALVEQELRRVELPQIPPDTSWLKKYQVKGSGKTHYTRADYYEEQIEQKFGTPGQ